MRNSFLNWWFPSLVVAALSQGVAMGQSAACPVPQDAVVQASALTTHADEQLRGGQPWLAMDTLKEALVANPCSGGAHLMRSRILRMESMYASERREIQAAYDLEPANPAIGLAWRRIVSPANDVLSIRQSLAGKDLDAETRKQAEASARGMESLLTENSQTCQVQPEVVSAVLPLLPSIRDGKHIDAYRLEIQLPQTKATLQVDTAASGLYISRALAEANGLQAGPSAGTVHVETLRIGPLVFRDCTVGVSDTPFAGKGDGFIGTDVFASYLITLDQPQAKLSLGALPPQDGYLPGDRSSAAALREFTPVYHKLHYLLVPVVVNGKERRLFVLDTGIRFSTMGSEVAHGVSATRVNFTNAVQTTSGATLQVYRDNFDFEFAKLAVRHQPHVLEVENAAVNENTGMKVAGMLGFDILHSMVIGLDYRDGLVRFESTDMGLAPGLETADGAVHGTITAAKETCARDEVTDHPIASTIEAVVVGYMDSAHLKAGQQVSAKVVHPWIGPTCQMSQGALIYGHVTAAGKGAGGGQLGIVFDHGDCLGQDRRALPLKLIGVVAAPDQFKGLHDVLPVQLRGGGQTRQISDVAASMDNTQDQNIGPQNVPQVIHAGEVVGLPRLTMEPEGGPACSALLKTAERSVMLGAGTDFIVAMESGTP